MIGSRVHRSPVGRVVAAAAAAGSLVAGMTGIGLTDAAISGAAAEDSPARIQVVLESLSPAIPTAGQTLRLRGRVINTSQQPVDDVGILLRRSSAPVATRLDVADIAALDGTPDREPTDVPLPGTRVEVADRLAPGELQAFSVRVPVASIGFTDPGSYPIALEVLGRADGEGTDSQQGILRTFLPWVPSGTEVEPVSLAWLWPLAGWPAVTVSGVLLDDQTAAELAPEGRLGALVTLGERNAGTVSWIADPALLQVAAQMSQGYRVVRSGVEVVGDADATARAWLDQVSRIARTFGLRTLPYADVDASALVRGGLSTDVVRAVTRGPGIADAAVQGATTGTVYWAPSGRLDRAALDVLASAGVSTVVVSADAMPALDDTVPVEGQATAALPTGFTSMRAILADPGLTAILDLPQLTESDVIAARQRFLAETATLALTLDSTERALVAAPSTVRWRSTSSLVAPLLRATRTAPWLRPVALSTLLEEPTPSTMRRRGGYGERAREGELPRTYVTAISRTTTQLDAFTSIIDNPVGVTEPFSEALLRAASSGWRTQPVVGDELLATIRDDLGEQTARVRVLSEGTLTLSGESGRVPVTIANDLDRSVTVGVALRSLPSLRLSSEPIEGVRIEAGRMASIDLDARVVGSEPLPVQVQLLGPDGEDYGRPATITLVSTAYAQAAAWVVAAAFLAIVIFVVVGVARRIRKARAAARPGSRPA